MLLQEFFWNIQKKLIVNEFGISQTRTSNALSVVAEYKIQEAIDEVKNLLNSTCEITICEAVSTLKQLNSLTGIEKSQILVKIKDENQKALIESLFL